MKTHHIVLSIVAICVATGAHAAPAASCTLQSTSRLDALLNPTQGSDERFFTAGSGPPNILFLLDTSCSMTWWPMAWSNNWSNSFDDDSSGVYPGCRQGNVDALGYDPAVTYARMWINLTTESPWFVSTSYYRFDGSGGGMQSSFNMGNDPLDFTSPPTGTTISLDPDTACNNLTGNDASALGPCKTCLANKGYFQYEDDRRLAIGNFLNFYGPRGQGAVNAMTNAIKNSTKARFGVIAFSAGTGAPNTYQWPGNSVNLFQGMGPSCANSLLPAQIASNSDALIQKLASYIQFNTSTPLDQYLFAGMHYFRSTPPTAGAVDPFPGWFPGGYPTDANFDNTANAGNPAICFACGFSAMILLTDGQPNQSGFELPSEIRALPTPCPSCGGAAAGVGNDTQGGNSHIFRTADWAWNHDLRSDTEDNGFGPLVGQQRLATYTVAYALNDANTLALLQATATAGGGNYYLATNSSQLATSLSAIINDVTNRNIAFSSSSISSFQTGSTNAAILPRMAPGKNNLPWTGALWRFNQFNEFVESQDISGDADQADIFVVDKSCDTVTLPQPATAAATCPGARITEDATGAFLRGAGPALAVPFWEARAKMLTQPNDTTRNILTVLDGNADGVLNGSDAMSGFTKANWATLAPYLGVLGTPFCPKAAATGICDSGAHQGQYCLVAGDCGGGNCDITPGVFDGTMAGKFGLDHTQLAAAVGVAFAVPLVPTQLELDEVCVKSLIQFIRGQDLGDEDGDTDIAELRLSVLGDIFHSSPQVVDPPVDRFLCDIALHNQCVSTLYSDKLGGVPMTPMASAPLARCGAAAAPVDAYDTYIHNNRRREKVVLVGANDGMLHAFLDSRATETQAGGLCTDVFTPPLPYPASAATLAQLGNSGGGGELWAFIPPDQLSRLQELVLGHTYFIDGDAMIRDIWADGSGATAVDGVKQADEFHTVAVVAEGRGGTSYFALEMRATPTAAGVAGGGVTQDPKFLWMFPQPNSQEALLMGKTLLSLTPRPPPIGPVLLKNTTPNGVAGRYGGTEERWVAMLSGGWSPGNEKGRAIFMVDVYNGLATVNGVATGRTDNLLFKLDYDEFAVGKKHGSKKGMQYGMVAPIAMVDYGPNVKTKQDGFFDTAVFGDMAGQLWTLRMHVPGEITGAGNLIDNWSAGRAFQMDRDGIADGNKSVRNRSPFWYLTSLGIQPDTGTLRAMAGTGDRYSLLDDNAGRCRFDNPLACAKYGCKVEIEYEAERLTDKVNEVKLKWENTRDAEAKTVLAGAGYTACGVPGSVEVKAKIKKNEVNDCPKQGGGDDDFNDIRKYDAECGQDPLGNFICRRTDNNADALGDLNFPIENARLAPGWLGNNRFFAVRVYGGPGTGGGPPPVFDETGATAIGAEDYDALRLTDRTVADPTGGDLIDVTGTTCNTAGVCGCATPPCKANKDDHGWVIDYVAGLSHKTGGGSSVLSSCVLWNVVFPSTSLAACSTSAAKSRFFQADFISGSPNCAEGLKNISAAGVWDRYAERAVLAPPPEPATAIAINKVTGQLKYSSVVLEPGAPQATEIVVTQGQDVLQSVSSLPLTRQEHLCRHVGRVHCNTVQP